MDYFSLRQYLKDNGAKLNPGLRSLKIPNLGYLKWFETGGNPPMQLIRSDNEVIPLIDGPETFKSMHEALMTATSKGHFIYLIGWWLSDDLMLVENKPESTIQNIFKKASDQGVQIRAMLWYQHYYPDKFHNSKEAERINKLNNGAAILDSRHLWYGSHHQKILVVKGTNGLIAFCGGVDINPDRVCSPCTWTTQSTDGCPYHDVHCKIRGPAAYDLLNIFLERWQDHGEHEVYDLEKGILLGLAESVPLGTGSLNVQIGRTYGSGRDHGMSYNKPYSGENYYAFAPKGEKTVSRLILKTIKEARRFIYIEDQYLVNMEASKALIEALPKIEHLTILIPDGSIVSIPQINYQRQQFIAPLKKAGGGKVRVFKLVPPGSPHTYVHSKTYIIDDKFAIIGSANCNRRSWTNDSEIMAGIYDPTSGEFARHLRIALWAEHLNMSKDDPRLANGVASAEFWLRPSVREKSRVDVYDENQNVGIIGRLIPWNIIDPDGSYK